MSNERYVYCQVILKLMKKGYEYKTAKFMFYKSDILEQMHKDTVLFFHYYPNDWVKWILKDKIKKNTCLEKIKYKILKILK